MAGHDGIALAGHAALLGGGVAVADAAGLDPHADLAWAGLRQVSLHQLEGAAGVGDLDRPHSQNGASPATVTRKPERVSG